jgi:hypothetical protein
MLPFPYSLDGMHGVSVCTSVLLVCLFEMLYTCLRNVYTPAAVTGFGCLPFHLQHQVPFRYYSRLSVVWTQYASTIEGENYVVYHRS